MCEDINARTDGGIRLTRTEAEELVESFLVKKLTRNNREEAVGQQAKELGVLASEVHGVTSDLERDVATTVGQISQGSGPTSELATRLSAAERELAELRKNVANLQLRIEGKSDEPTEINRDTLTHALNRVGARDLLNNIKSDGRDYVVIMFGLDKLAELNDKFDRSVGDNILNALASTLRDCFQDEELIRWSGNAFIVVLRGTALRQARIMAEEALLAMSQRRLRLRGTGEWIGVVTASAGIMVGQREVTTEILEQAQAKLLFASEAGGNRVED